MEWSPPVLPTTPGIRPSGMGGADATYEFEAEYESSDCQDGEVLLGIEQRIKDQRENVLKLSAQARYAEWSCGYIDGPGSYRQEYKFD